MPPSFALDDPRLSELFWAKVSPEPNTGCWIWIAAVRSDGYGYFNYRHAPQRERSTRSAHRLAYETLVGAVPLGLELDHLCRTRSCCNPGHLEPVTRQQNVQRGLRGALHVQCPHGHAFTPDNTGTNNRGHRFCRTCNRAQGKARYGPLKERIPQVLCKRGHVLADTARLDPNGSRRCLECANIRQRHARDRDVLAARDLLGA